MMLLSTIHAPVRGADPEPQRIQIEADEFTFTLSTPVLERGRPTVLTIINRGKMPHEFLSPLFEGGRTEVEWDGVVVEGKGIEEVELAPGKKVEITFVPRKKGKIPFVCDLPGHMEQGMKGSILVR